MCPSQRQEDGGSAINTTISTNTSQDVCSLGSIPSSPIDGSEEVKEWDGEREKKNQTWPALRMAEDGSRLGSCRKTREGREKDRVVASQ